MFCLKTERFKSLIVSFKTITSTLVFLSIPINIALAENHKALMISQVSFNSQEQVRIEQLGPWPPKLEKDITNSLSSLPLAQDMGKALFFDTGLSANQQISCASCHQPGRFFNDQQALAQGIELGIRNTPTLLNTRFKRWYGWGGATDTLWGASIRALLNPHEMASSPKHLENFLTKRPSILESLQSLPEWRLTNSPQDKLVIISKLLAAYQEQLISPESEFDRFRKALMNQDIEAQNQYSDSKKRGLKLFIGKGNCHICHTGVLLSNNEFADIGLSYFDRKGQIDKGRYQGIKSLKASPFSSLGPYNQDTSNNSRIQAQHLVLKHRNFGEFMVPSLRNLNHTAPYMHQGSLNTLDEVIEHYSNLDETRLHTDGMAILKPLKLSAQEKADLKAFLKSL